MIRVSSIKNPASSIEYPEFRRTYNVYRSLGIVSSIAQRLLNDQYAVLETSRSYHVIGTHLLNEEEVSRFLSKAILFSPITDHAYIAHQLLEAESALRITGRDEQGDVPSLVAVG